MAEKKLNGLTKPLNLSPELAAIVGAKKDEKLARSEIVKRLWAYLKAQNLQVLFCSYIMILSNLLNDKCNSYYVLEYELFEINVIFNITELSCTFPLLHS